MTMDLTKQNTRRQKSAKHQSSKDQGTEGSNERPSSSGSEVAHTLT